MKISKKLKQFWTLLKTSDSNIQELEQSNKDLTLEIQILNKQIEIHVQDVIQQQSLVKSWKNISYFLGIYSIVISLVVIALINEI